MTDFELALSDICQAWPALQPPNRVRVSEGAAQNLKIARPGGASGSTAYCSREWAYTGCCYYGS